MLAPQSEAESAPGRERPWWGLGDVALGVMITAAAAFIGTVASLAFISDFDRTRLDETDAVPALTTVLGLVTFQLAMGLWPAFVARKKGHGAAVDFRFQLKAVDLGIGAGVLAVMFPVAIIANVLVSKLVGLEAGADEASNVDVLADLQGPALFFVLVGAVLGAPIVEELFFRGLCLRAIEKRAGKVAAVLGSTVLFVLPHFTWSTWQGTAVLFASIGVVGLVLAIVAVRVNRLGPTIVAHSLFNLIGSLGALYTT